MAEQRPRLRDSKQLATQTLYPLNVFPRDIINKIGKHLVYLIHIGRKDISGNDWSDVKFRLRKPPTLRQTDVLKGLGFDESWITVSE